MSKGLFVVSTIFFLILMSFGNCAIAGQVESQVEEKSFEDVAEPRFLYRSSECNTTLITPYTLGPLDVVKIDVWRHSEFSLTIPIDSRGILRFPMLGDIKVLGMAPYEVADFLTEKLKEYIKRPQVRVDVVEYKSRKIIVMGAVNKPGIYYVDTDRLSVLEAAMIAGGFTVDAKLDRIQIARGSLNNFQVIKVNIHRAILKGEKERDIALQPGDIVYVPKTIWGNINQAINQIMPSLNSYSYTKSIGD